MVDRKTKSNTELERIEFAKPDYGTRIIPHVPGTPMPPYASRDLGPWQTRNVTISIANLLRELCRRGEHGVAITKVHHDDIAELALLGVPYKLTDWDKTNTWGKKLFVVISVVLRFAEDCEVA